MIPQATIINDIAKYTSGDFDRWKHLVLVADDENDKRTETPSYVSPHTSVFDELNTLRNQFPETKHWSYSCWYDGVLDWINQVQLARGY